MSLIRYMLAVFSIVRLVSPVWADDIPRDELQGLDEQVQAIKSDVLDLTSELSRLEEKLLFPSNSQVALFVSLGDDKFRLDSAQVKLDSQVVANYLYNFRELEALKKGGVQRIYTGNLGTGDHELVVSVSGKGNAGAVIQRSATYTVKKAVGPKFVEIKITEPNAAEQSIRFQDW